MVKALKILILLLFVIVSIWLFSFIKQESPVVKTLPVLIESKLHAQGQTYVPLSDIPYSLQRAIIDTEDQRFYSNPGVSIEGIIRSILRDLISQSFQEGGSTITQQLAKNQILGSEKTFSRKLKEVILALMITSNFSKQDILAMYLNSVYFGHGAWGIDAAAQIYFNKPVSELTPGQSTLLAGLPQSPSFFDPFKNLTAARSRQKQVVDAMLETGDLDQNKATEIMNMPINLHY